MVLALRAPYWVKRDSSPSPQSRTKVTIVTNPNSIEYEVLVHDDEDGSLWAEIPALPGLFVSGNSDEELAEALVEAVPLYLTDAGHKPFRVVGSAFAQTRSGRVLVDC